MKIVIETGLVISKQTVIDILNKYNVFSKKSNAMGRYELINGDVISIVSERRNDGLRADVAIGMHAQHLTALSTQTKRVWTYEDLDRYLQEVKGNG